VAKRTVFMAKMRDSYEILDGKIESQKSYLLRRRWKNCVQINVNPLKTKIKLNYIECFSSYATPGLKKKNF